MLPIIDRTGEEPIRRQIYRQLKEQLLSGALQQGEALASTRQLAGELGVSRSTVVEAYDMLLAEGFLESRQGSQTVVAAGIAMAAPHETATQPKVAQPHSMLVDFSTGKPDLSQFPRAQWIRLLCRSAQHLQPASYGYTGPQGYKPLREEIAAWLSRSRGIFVCSEDVFITAGATHALRILADLLCTNGGRVIMEDPCHKGLFDTLNACHCGIVPIPADDHGMQTDLLNGSEHAQLIYVTPSHQFPLGGILPAARRAALIRYAREQSIFVAEDDYDSEFRFTGAPITPLYALDPQRVIYIGTFSKSVFPALRIGFVLLPSELQARWRDLRTHNDIQNPVFDQAALASFLNTRSLDRHARTMRKHYAKRRQALANALTDYFGAEYSICGDAAGLHLAVRFHGKRFYEGFHAFCLERGINVSEMESHCIRKGNHMDELLLGYGHLPPEEIQNGVRLLADAMRAYAREQVAFDLGVSARADQMPDES
ncbi:MAG: PLP-dependent aminotransferase family protein [Eubacteriales bacterium]|jgi:GntR family transcriptional regulator/MocR family aminotransferase|nr:PLP-dependent aminotransferase family protein [Eubacteriales bacterium]